MKRRGVSEVFRKDMRFKQETPYASREKYPSNTRCPECSVLFSNGVWKWASPDPRREVKEKLCPACRQIQDDYAGGELVLAGAFVTAHRNDIMNRIRNIEEAAKKEHPLERIMRTADEGGTVVVRTTSEHLAARMAKALHSDYEGDVEISYADGDKFVRARWSRDA